MANNEDNGLSALFHALADSTRRVILDELSERDGQALFEICVRLVERHGMSLTRQAISRHLGVLEGADLVEVRWDGRTKLHSSKLSRHLPRLTKWLNKHNAKE